MKEIVVPDYSGGSLVNLIADLEHRLTGSAPSPTLHKDLHNSIEDAETYVFVLFDGLGSHQLDHPEARDLAATHRGDLDAPFPYTTTVSLASIATGLPPSRHGLLGYQLWMEEVGTVVNTIHMTTLHGGSLDFDYGSLLPVPNLCERIKKTGREAIAVQPETFDRSPLTRALYRDARFEAYSTPSEAIERTLEASSNKDRFVFLYLPFVDYAAHLAGQGSPEYADAMRVANMVWRELIEGLPDSVTLVGTADHGHVDIPESNKIRLNKGAGKGRILYGVERAMFIKGEGESLAEGIPATWVPYEDLPDLWGPGPHHETFKDRRPDGILFAEDGYAVFHKGSDDRFVGHHGGLMTQERVIPLLVR